MYTRLYWFFYRRRDRVLLTLFIAFIVIVVYSKSQSKSPSDSSSIDKPKAPRRLNKIRINRETYQIPEPCRGCPGENGSGVTLTVLILILLLKILSLRILGGRIQRFGCSEKKRIFQFTSQ